VSVPVRWRKAIRDLRQRPGRSLLTVWLRRSGRYREAIRRTLRKTTER